ncbi:MAG: hypothetical protein N2559_03305 [Anaerolineae bacterium]|nr:hypothetical protein [Anaerolineae bacterium]
MSIAEFKNRVAAALAKHLPYTTIHFEERRGTEIRGHVHIDDVTRIEIYYSAITGKTSYALIQADKRIFGYDNFRFWHCHPAHNPDEHVMCEEPTPERVLREMRQILGLE